MKKKTSTILLIVGFFIGLAVLLYPTVSNYLNQINASHAVSNYDETMASLDETQNEQLLAAAEAYNADLAARSAVYVDGAPQDSTYTSLLNVTGDGMMGYLTIKKLGVQLPIYHGTSDDVLADAAGHLEGSSLPVGGESTHAVLTGHRGLPSAKLFTDLDKLEIGDTFTITVLNKTLTYEVDQIQIVLPEEVDDLAIEPGKDYVTLVTCTPYAVNTHRLLVRGVRVDQPDETIVAADAMEIDPVIVAPAVAAPMLLILFVLLLTGRRRRPEKPGKPGERDGEEK